MGDTFEKKAKQKENLNVFAQEQEQEQRKNYGIIESYQQYSEEYKKDEIAQKNDKASKWESQDKKEKRSERIARMQREEEEKQEFFRPMAEMGDKMMTHMENLVEKKSQGEIITAMHMADEFQVCVDDAAAFAPEELLKDDAAATVEFRELCTLYTEMRNYSPADFMPDQAKNMLEKYQMAKERISILEENKEQNRVLEATASRYLFGKIQEDHIEEATAFVDPQACYILLMNTITVALKNCVNYMGEENINIFEFSKLCGLAEATTIASSYVLMHSDFLKKQKEYAEVTKEKRRRQQEDAKNEIFRQEAEQKILEERQRLLDEKKQKEELRKQQVTKERLPVIAQVVNQIAKDDIWPKALLYQLSKEMIGETITTKNEKEFIKKINVLREALQDGLGKVHNFLNAHEDLYLSMGLLREQLYALVVERMGNSLLEETNAEKEKQLLKEMKQCAPVLIWQKRKKAFTDGLAKHDVNYSEDELTELWNSKDIQALILNTESDDVYQKNVDELTEQAWINSNIIISLVAKNFFSINRTRAVKQIRKYMGSSWVTGSPNVIQAETMNFISDMNLLDAKLHHREVMLKNIVKTYGLEGFEEATAIAVRDNVSSELVSLNDKEYYKEEELEEAEKTIQNEWKKLETEEVKEKLGDIKAIRITNENYYIQSTEKRKYTPEDWRKIEEWLSKNIFQPPKTFESFLMKYLNEILENSKKNPKTKPVSLQVYKEQRKAEERSGNTYKSRLLGDDFLAKEEFADMLAGREEALQAAFNLVFSDEEWKNRMAESMPFVKKADSVESLENLTNIEYRLILTHLQDNFRKCLLSWQNINGTYADEIKNELLADILLGEVNEENIKDKIKEANSRRVDEKIADTVRFHTMLEVGKDVTLENRFRQLKTREESKGLIHWGITEDMSKSRVGRFVAAKELWEKVYENGLETKMLLICNQFLDDFCKDWEEQIKKKADSQRQPFFAEKSYAFAKKVLAGEQSVLGVFSAQEQNVIKTIFGKSNLPENIQEFLLCGAENMIFENKSIEELFLAKSENAASYRNHIAERAMLAGKRSKDMAEWLHEIKNVRDYKPSWIQHLCELRLGLQEIEGTEEQKEKKKTENKERFGIESWEKVCEEMNFLLLNNMGEIPVENREEMERKEEGILRFNHRRNQMEKYGEGIFEPILPYLIVRPEILKVMTEGSEEQFVQYMKELEISNVGKISRMISQNLPMHLQGAFVLQYQEDVISGKDIGEFIWMDRISACVSQYANRIYENNRSELKKALDKIGFYTDTPYRRREFVTRVIKNTPELRVAGTAESTIVAYVVMKAENYGSNVEYVRAQLNSLNVSKEDSDEFLWDISEIMLKLTTGEFIMKFKSEFLPNYQKFLENRDRNEVMGEMIGTQADQFLDRISRGKTMDAKIREELSSAGSLAWETGSPLVASFELGDKKIEKKQYEAAGKYAADRKAEYPEAVLRCLTERHMIAQLEGKLLEHDVIEAYTKTYNNLKKINPELSETQLRELIVFCRHFMKSDTGGKGTYEERVIHEYSYRTSVMEELCKIECKDVIVQTEFQDFMECMGMGKFSMTSETFRKVTENRKKYFINLNAAFELFESYLTERMTDRENMPKYKEILRAYFRKDIIEGTLTKDDVIGITEQWLMNDDFRNILLQKIDASDAAGNDIVHEEQSVRILIETVGSTEMQKKYGALDDERKQLFAMALMIPGKAGVNDILPNADLLNGEEEFTEKQEKELQAQAQNYIEQKPFLPKIQYSKVMKRLQTADGKIDQENFNLAMSFVELCSNQREERVPKDWERIGNGISSIEAAVRIKGIHADEMKNKMPEHVDGMDSFRNLLEKYMEEEQDESKVKSVRSRVEALFKGNKVHILIVALQNRSMLDYTTGTSFIDRANGKVHEFANEELYQHSKEFWGGRSKEEDNRMMEKANTGEFCTRAMQMLFSYQLKDHVNFTGREITRDDFAKNALSRNSAIDWSLLERALDFVDETETEHLRITAAHNAKNYIQYGTNEAAKLQSRKWKKLFKEERDRARKEQYSKETALAGNKKTFEKFLLEHGSGNNKEVAALLSGYFCLSDTEKELFAKALQNRDILDVSKRNLWMNQFGLADRDYVNAKGRDELMNEYVSATLSKDGRINISEQAYGDAVQNLLSTQMDDSIDFSQYRDKNAEEFMANEHFYRKDRKTAVDWKLFRRALQFVHRSSNERRIYEQDREIFLAGKQNNQEAEFQFDNAFLRRNLHRSGNRVSRFVGKRLLANIIDRFPVKYHRIALMMMPVKAANYLNGIEDLQKEEKLEEKLEKILEVVADDTKEKKPENKKPAEEVKKITFEEDPRLSATRDIQMNILKEVSREINLLEDEKEEIKSMVETAQNFSGYLDEVEEKGKELLEKGLITSAAEYGFSKIYDNKIVMKGVTLVTSEADKILEGKAVSKVTDAVGKEAAEEFTKQLQEVGEKYKDVKEALDDSLETAQNALAMIQNVIDCSRKITDKAISKQYLKVSGDRAKDAREDDTKLVEEQKTVLTEKQKNLLDKGREDIVKAGEIASDVRSAHITTEMVETVGNFIRDEVAGNLLSGDTKEYVQLAMQEVQELVVFLRGIFIDKNMLEQYYGDANEEITKLRRALMNADNEKYKSEETFGILSNLEVVQIAKGFESETELASFVGMNLIQAILFSASEDNPIMEAKIRAKAVLVALDMKQYIGRRDSTAASEVFKKLMKEDYR